MNASLSVTSVTQIKSIIMINVNVSANSQKNFTCANIYIYIYIYIYIWNTATCSFEKGKHSGSIIDDSVIMRDEIINAAKIVSKNINSSMSSIKKCY